MSSTQKSGQQPSASEEGAAPYPKMDLCQDIHRLVAVSAGESKEKDLALEQRVFDVLITELENPSLYKIVYKKVYPNVEGGGAYSEADLQALSDKHDATVKELEEKVKEAQESAGDMEVMESRLEIARFAAKSLTEQATYDAYKAVLDLPKLSSGKKIDALMESARVASFYGNTAKTDDFIQQAHKLSAEGGDWDRRNRLKVYRALQFLLHRDLQAASDLLMDCIATFSCNEMCTYTEFIVYAILSNVLFRSRPELKKKIIDGPEILSVANDIPVVIKLVRAFYDCDYRTYFQAMVEVEEVLLGDRFLHPHAAYWMRELHILAYKQFLDSYQSVTLEAMANAFGVSQDFIDYHASRFIAADRLSAKIDKFGGVIVTNRPDLKNAQYREMIQKGDHLLNRIQKLARVVDI